MSDPRHLLGRYAEEQAVIFLKNKGYRILERNVRLKWGEIDIVAQDDDTICFVEVRSNSEGLGLLPIESIHFAKQKKLSLLAKIYLKKKYQSVDVKARFDIVAISLSPSQVVKLELFQNAFDSID